MGGGFEDKLNAILGDKNAMGQIMALAQSLSGAQQQQTDEAAAGCDGYVPVEETDCHEGRGPDVGNLLNSVDPAMLQLGLRLVQEYNRSDNDAVALLSALRPFVKPSRYAKLDRAARAAKLSGVVRIMLNMLKESRGMQDV